MENFVAFRYCFYTACAYNRKYKHKNEGYKEYKMEVDYKKTVAGVREDLREDGIDDSEYSDDQIRSMIENGF